jgi:nucleotide-binding universal stress UspA family protein
MSRMAAQPRRIVVGYDDSESARRALDRAADLTGYGSALAVVSVAPTGGEMSAAALESARERLLRRHVTATYLQPVGEPAAELVGTARELEADLVVVGRRNHSLRRLVLGSVSADVVRSAPCDVLVVS